MHSSRPMRELKLHAARKELTDQRLGSFKEYTCLDN